MESICFIGLIGLAALAAGIGTILTRGCKKAGSGSSPADALGNPAASVIDAKKEKDIKDLTK